MNAPVRKVTTGLEVLVLVTLVSKVCGKLHRQLINLITSVFLVNILFTDVNECGFDNGNCSHTCVNMGGTYRCECPSSA